MSLTLPRALCWTRSHGNAGLSGAPALLSKITYFWIQAFQRSVSIALLALIHLKSGTTILDLSCSADSRLARASALMY